MEESVMKLISFNTTYLANFSFPPIYGVSNKMEQLIMQLDLCSYLFYFISNISFSLLFVFTVSYCFLLPTSTATCLTLPCLALIFVIIINIEKVFNLKFFQIDRGA